jgi:hypothetical protein
MRSETRLKSFFFCVGPYLKFALAMVLCAGGVVLADWDVGDPALYYQLPDYSDGWSVYGDGGGAEPVMAADDWTAATTTTITDIYFWGGWERDHVGEAGNILIQIFNNNPAEPDFPRPDECVWSRVINEGQYTVRPYQEQWQGFYDPRQADEWLTGDHENLSQYSIPVIASPFIQQAGLTYWLMISMDVQGGVWGWNTAGSVSGGSAVFWDENNAQWAQLMTADGYVPMDMAFVITPEPTTLLLLGLGAAVLRKKARN